MSVYEKSNEKDSRPVSQFADTDIDHKSKAEDSEVYGRIVGGTHVEELGETDSTSEEKNGQLMKVDIDLPLTLTTTKQHEGQEIILLTYADGDKENPFNWSLAKKRVITGLLCSMTLFIGMCFYKPEIRFELIKVRIGHNRVFIWNRQHVRRFWCSRDSGTTRTIHIQLCLCPRTALPCSVHRICGKKSRLWRSFRLLYIVFHRIGFGPEHRHHHCHEDSVGNLWLRGNHLSGRNVF